MDHMKILKRAWQIVKTYRALWWIGLLLVFAGGGLGAGSGSSVPGSSGSGWRASAPTDVEPFEGWPELPDMPDMPDLPAWPQMWDVAAPAVAVIAVVVVVLALVAIGISLVLTVLRFVTRGSLIKMVHGYEETGEEIGFKAGLRLGWSRSAWRLFLLDLMLTLPVVLVVLALLVPLGFFAYGGFASDRVGLGVVAILAFIPVILLGVVLGIVLGPIRELAYRSVVLKELGPWKAFVATLGLVRHHLGPAALQWLILVGMRIAWGIVLIPVNLILGFVALFAGGLPGLLVGGIAALAAGWPLGLILGGLVFLPIAIVVVALPNLALKTLATVYHSTTWTLTYRELLALNGGAPELDVVEAELDEGSDLELTEAKVQ
jgi:hypothetical protein